jgi:hypothetical protein
MKSWQLAKRQLAKGQLPDPRLHNSSKKRQHVVNLSALSAYEFPKGK